MVAGTCTRKRLQRVAGKWYFNKQTKTGRKQELRLQNPQFSVIKITSKEDKRKY